MLILLIWWTWEEVGGKRAQADLIKELLTKQSRFISLENYEIILKGKKKKSPSCAWPAQVGGFKCISVEGAHTGVRNWNDLRERLVLSARHASMWVSYLGSCQCICKLGSWPSQLACDHKCTQTQRGNTSCQPRNICIATAQSKCSVQPPEPFPERKMLWLTFLCLHTPLWLAKVRITPPPFLWASSAAQWTGRFSHNTSILWWWIGLPLRYSKSRPQHVAFTFVCALRCRRWYYEMWGSCKVGFILHLLKEDPVISLKTNLYLETQLLNLHTSGKRPST